VFYSAGVEDEGEAVPGVDTARWFGIGRAGCAAPNVQTAVAGYVGQHVVVRDFLLPGLVPRPTFIESGLHVRSVGESQGTRWLFIVFRGRRSHAGL
jgi:hypothetical protein